VLGLWQRWTVALEEVEEEEEEEEESWI